MDDQLRVQIPQSQRGLLDELARFDISQFPRCLQPLLQSATDKFFKCDERHLADTPDLERFHDMQVINFQRDSRFAAQSSQPLFAATQRRRKNLEADRLMKIDVLRVKDIAKPPNQQSSCDFKRS